MNKENIYFQPDKDTKFEKKYHKKIEILENTIKDLEDKNTSLKSHISFLRVMIFYISIIFFNIIIFNAYDFNIAESIIIGLFEIIIGLVIAKKLEEKITLGLWEEIISILKGRINKKN